ncbi:MAG: hypothetical protein IT197_05610 [Acidimicrobiia bacterium]|nr:hypothetical protein [Acidimicrobiia bacterium]
MIVDDEANEAARRALDAGVPDDEVLAMLLVAYEPEGEEYARFMFDLIAGRARSEDLGHLE